MHRVHRDWRERPWFTSVHRCFQCDFVLGVPHRPLRALLKTLRWLFAHHTTCIQCGRADVERHPGDRIDRETGHILSRLLRLCGAPLIRCSVCRITYRDWRRPASKQA